MTTLLSIIVAAFFAVFALFAIIFHVAALGVITAFYARTVIVDSYAFGCILAHKIGKCNA